MNKFDNISKDALMTAAIFGYKEPVVYLYETGVEMAGYNNQIARNAATNGQLDTIEYMYQKHMFEAAGYNAYGAALQAAAHGQLDVLKFLYNTGIRIVLNQNAAMKEAAANGHLNTLQFLHEEHDAEINLADNGVMKNAICNGRLDVIKYLRDKGISFRECESSILYVYSKGHNETIEYLQSQGIYTDGEYVTNVIDELIKRNPVLNDANLFIYQDKVMVEIETEDEDVKCYQLLQINTEYPQDVETGLNVDNMIELFGECYEYIPESKNYDPEY